MHTTIDHDIVQMLVNAGPTLPHEVRERIVSRGARAVPTLLALARGEMEREGSHSRWPWLHAVELLGDIKDPATIEPLLEILIAEPLYYTERNQLVSALAATGERVLEPALRVHASSEGAGADVAMLLARLGVRDERIFAILLDHLQRDLQRGAGLLADYGDPRAVEHLHQAFDAYQPWEPRSAESVLFSIETALQRLGSDITAEQRQKYVDIVAAREQRRALAHEREKQTEKDRKLAQQKQRTQSRKRRKQQRASRKKNR
jgi:hypothetical protein